MLEAAISQIEKQHGKGAIMRLGNRDVLVPVSVIPAGALFPLLRRWAWAACRAGA